MVVCKNTLNDIKEVGYGTAYERKLLNSLLKRLVKTYKIRFILEYPANDLLGDYRVLYRDIDACVKRSRLVKSGEYDLVWNFCEIEKTTSPRRLLAKMIELTANYILLVGQNLFNLGVPLHRAYHALHGSAWYHGDLRRMRLGYVMELIRSQGLVILEHGYLDAPIFVLDLYECGSLLRGCFTDNSRYRSMLLKESPFERLPRLFKPLFCHHWYLLCQRPKMS